ncbi:MAG: hypothetical protein LBQ95_07325 [Lachnospiraceae bacterium]|jgi:hypothetical protein|nr:hypothetical protein [Lachnospiraceae bacterium]
MPFPGSNIDYDKSPKAWGLRVIYFVVSLWLAYVAAASVIRVMYYLTFVALPLWIPSAGRNLYDAQIYILQYAVAIQLFVWMLFSVGYVKNLGRDVWKQGKFSGELVRYIITAVGLTILSSMLDTSKQMRPATFFTVIGIALVSYFIIKIVSNSIKA